MRNQGRNHYLGECVFRILRDKIAPRDVDRLKEWAQIEYEEERSNLMIECVYREYPVNIVDFTQDPVARRIRPMLESAVDGSRPHVHGSSLIF
jgi:hypothetical protein